MSELSIQDGRARTAHRISLAAAAVVIALALISIGSRPASCGDLADDYPPIIAFELARSGDDLAAIFGDRSPAMAACRHTMITAMDRANYVDLALFMPAYGALLVAAFVGLRRRSRPAATAGIALAILAVAADIVENVCLLGLTPTPDPGSSWLAVLAVATAVKWLALGAAGAVAGVALWPGLRHHRVTAALCMITPLATIAAIADPHRFGPFVGTGVAVSWIMLLVDGVPQARRR